MSTSAMSSSLHPQSSDRTDTADNILANVIEVTGWCTSVVGAVPIPGLGEAVDLFSNILKSIEATRLNYKDLRGLYQEMRDLLDSIKKVLDAARRELEEYSPGSQEGNSLEDRLKSSNTALAGRVQSLQSELIDIRDKANELTKRCWIARWFHRATDARALTDLKERVAGAHRRFNIEGQIRVEVLVAEAMRDTKKMLANQKAKDDATALDSLLPAHDADYKSSLNFDKGRFLAGTRQKVFNTLESWVEGQTFREKPLLLLTASAGSGKSTIAYELCRRAALKDQLGASFFFMRSQSRALQSSKTFVPTIAYQLAHSHPSLHPHIAAAAQKHREGMYGPVERLQKSFEALIREPLKALLSSDPNHPPILVVIDAVDECVEEDALYLPHLLRLLVDCALHLLPLRILLTSRPEGVDRLRDTSAADPDYLCSAHTVLLHEIDGDSVTADITALIEGKLQQYAQTKAWSAKNPGVIRELAQRADGLFVYAQVVADFLISPLRRQNPQVHYETLMSDPTLNHQPLSQLYLTILEYAFPEEELDPKVQKQLQRILELLVVLQEQEGISPRTLESLTGIPTKESIPVLNNLRSVILFERNNSESRFRVVHVTFREFVVHHLPTSGRGSKYRSKRLEPEIHARLALDCMRVLCFFAYDHRRRKEAEPVRRLVSRGSLNGLDSHHVLYAFDYLDYHHRCSGDHLSIGNATDTVCGWDNIKACPPCIVPIMMDWLKNYTLLHGIEVLFSHVSPSGRSLEVLRRTSVVHLGRANAPSVYSKVGAGRRHWLAVISVE